MEVPPPPPGLSTGWRMLKHLDFLNIMNRTHSVRQRALLDIHEPDQVPAIYGCVFRVAPGDVSVSQGIKEEFTSK